MSCNLNKNFLSQIKEIPHFTCCSCDRFLFQNQVFYSKKSFDLLRISESDILCQFCNRYLSKSQIPYRNMNYNNLQTGNIQRELQHLDIVEKRLISKINTFFTLIVLPCYPVGQLAQKGFAIHFFTNISHVASELPRTSNDNNLVCFSGTSAKENILPYNSAKVKKALEWLIDNNFLYRDIILSESNKFHASTLTTHNFDTILEYGVIPNNYAYNINASHNSDFKPLQVTVDPKPVNFLTFKKAEELAFPWLFPYGKGGYDAERIKKLTLCQYYKIRLYSAAAVWRKDITYLMHAVNTYEKNYLSQLISVYMKVQKGNNFTSPLLSASDLQSCNSSVLRANSYLFMKKIRGTAAYWKNTLFNLLAMIRNIGPPTLFLTLSSNDYHWEELAMTLQLCNRVEDINIKSLPNDVKQDPLMTAIHFDRKWRALFKYVLKGSSKPLGEINDHFIRVEFQARGSPHLHLFLWIKDAPLLETAKTENNMTTYIDKVISTTFPDESKFPNMHNLVKKIAKSFSRKVLSAKR